MASSLSKKTPYSYEWKDGILGEIQKNMRKINLGFDTMNWHTAEKNYNERRARGEFKEYSNSGGTQQWRITVPVARSPRHPN